MSMLKKANVEKLFKKIIEKSEEKRLKKVMK
jgi:hypothetical protein